MDERVNLSKLPTPAFALGELSLGEYGVLSPHLHRLLPLPAAWRVLLASEFPWC
jgi:hypothetical protein